MLVTAVAQLRLAASLVFGVPFAPWALDRLIDALRPILTWADLNKGSYGSRIFIRVLAR